MLWVLFWNLYIVLIIIFPIWRDRTLAKCFQIYNRGASTIWIKARNTRLLLDYQRAWLRGRRFEGLLRYVSAPKYISPPRFCSLFSRIVSKDDVTGKVQAVKLQRDLEIEDREYPTIAGGSGGKLPLMVKHIVRTYSVSRVFLSPSFTRTPLTEGRFDPWTFSYKWRLVTGSCLIWRSTLRMRRDRSAGSFRSSILPLSPFPPAFSSTDFSRVLAIVLALRGGAFLLSFLDFRDLDCGLRQGICE